MISSFQTDQIRFRIWMVLFLFIATFTFSCRNKKIYEEPKSFIQKGVLDLRNWDPSGEPKIGLNGEWNFYWNEWIGDPNSLTQFLNDPEKVPLLKPIPKAWQYLEWKDGQNYPTDGYAVYRLKIYLPEEMMNLGLYIPNINSAFELYLDGEKVAGLGKIEREISKIEFDYKYSYVYFENKSKELDLVLFIENYNNVSAGIWDAPRLGTASAIEKIHRENISLDFFLFGALLIMSFFHLSQYFLLKDIYSPLYFGIFCFLGALRVLSINERLLAEFLNFYIVLRIEYSTVFLGILFYIFFVNSLFPKEFNPKIFFGIKIFFFLGSFLALFSPFVVYNWFTYYSLYFLLIPPVYSFYVSIKAIRKKREGAKIFLAGNLVFILAMVLDVLVALDIIIFPYIASIGMLSFVISQALILAQRYTKSFKNLQFASKQLLEKHRSQLRKNKELIALKNSLEAKVLERTQDLEKTNLLIEEELLKSEKLLQNILPRQIAKELKEKGSTSPVLYERVSVLFTDFKGFTRISETMTPTELTKELDACFSQFDNICDRYNLEKLKTIGDSYMCAGGIPKKNNTNPIDIVMAALEIQAFMNQMKDIKEMLGLPYWQLRLGIHTGPLIAGVIGEKKFAYDVWGDTVNLASRMESSGEIEKVNISGITYELIKDFFDCEYRGKIKAKNKGEIDMYYVKNLKDDLVVHNEKLESSGMDKNRVLTPNSKFWKMYAEYW